MKEKVSLNLPKSIIDTHCHGRDLNQNHKSTVLQTLKEAASANITSTFFMPNTDQPIINLPTLDLYLDYIYRACSKLKITDNQHVWFGATDNNLNACIDALTYPNVIGIKVYPKAKSGETVTTGTIGVSDDTVMSMIISECASVGKAAAFHCDDPEIIQLDGYTKEAEYKYVAKIINIAKNISGAKIVICHVSCRESAELIIQARKDGLNIVLELCPQYLWFDSQGTNWNTYLDPVYYHCYNNLRGPEDRKFLVRLLAEHDVFIIIGSDNAPHTRDEKLEKRYGGLPTNQHMVSVILTLAMQNGVSQKRIADLLCYNAAKFFNIPVTDEKIRYILTETEDNKTYNNGFVENPWRGSHLLIPSHWR